MFKTLFIALLSAFVLQACQSQTSPGTENVLPKTAYQEKMSAIGNPQLLDVRTPEEYSAGHIEGATLINFFDENFLQRAEASFDKDKPLMLYCHSGQRSAKATAKLKAAGFKEIYDLEGGYKTWE